MNKELNSCENDNPRGTADGKYDRGEKQIPVDHILSAIKSIRYGYVQITVQDSKVVQIEKTEKIRLDKQRPGRATGGDEKGA